MFTDEQIKQLRQVIKEEVNTALKPVEEGIKQAIQASQEDTIKTLSELVHTGFDLHEKKIKRMEEHLHLPPLAE